MPAGISRPPDAWILGEHPFPGEGSLRAGSELLEFLTGLPPGPLEIFLSGGASSLAWVPPLGLGAEALHTKLQAFQAKGLSIEKLNRARSELCALKAGGAGRWMKKFAPRVRARVSLVSDVLPYGPEIVGSGPFWGTGIPHCVRADNQTWVNHVAFELKRAGVAVHSVSAGKVAPIEGITREIVRRVGSAPGAWVFGCEPGVKLKREAARGGRMSHLATLLALEYECELRGGRMEILGAASDGRDGESGGAGVLVDRGVMQSVSRPALVKALRDQSTGDLWRKCRALLPESAARTNVQDLVVVRNLERQRK